MDAIKREFLADDECLQVFFRSLLEMKTELGIEPAFFAKIRFGKRRSSSAFPSLSLTMEGSVIENYSIR